MTNLVEVRNLRVDAKTDARRRVEIIRDVSFEVREGEVIALIGESGSGKTTIAMSLMGYARAGCQIVGGSITIAGRNVADLSERECSAMRGTDVAYVPQSAAASFNPAHTIMDQVIEITKIHRLMSRETAQEKATELFRALGLPGAETIGDKYPHQLSGGQLQRLSAAMALIGSPKLVIFDEPTTALDVTTQIEVLRAFKSVMKRDAIAGVYVSHDLAVVAQIADRILVLKDGQVQEVGKTEDILRHARHPYTRQLLAAFEPSPRTVGVAPDAVVGKPLLKVNGVTAGYGSVDRNGTPTMVAVNDVSLHVFGGQNLGIIGESGCGKSTLARVIAGILPASKGSIEFGGKVLHPDLGKRSQEELRDLQIVFQFADTALHPAKSIEEILSRPLQFYFGMERAARLARVGELLDMVRLPRALRHRRPGELSGGQKQRVNLARALAARPKLILCDEITSALDTVVAAAVVDLLKELQQELSLSYLFISHDLSTIRSICDAVVVMYAGRKVEQLSPEQMGARAAHPYSQLLFSSVPKLETGWLDSLEQDPKLVREFAKT